MSDGRFAAELVLDGPVRIVPHRVKVYAHDGVRDAFGSIAAP